MPTGRSQFIGTAGQFYVAYRLSVYEINAAITLGNAPSVDLMASSADGRRTISIQVKTSRNAYRYNRYGSEGYEWDVNKGVIGKYHESFWYAFVNLQEEKEKKCDPEVFFVPSRWVAEFVKPDWSRYMYFLPMTVKELTYERWDLFSAYLNGEQNAVEWANSWPQDLLVKWGA
ncbi:MAG: hypothetical protein MR051_03440 [Lentisphaeria bacterium]|nr:hypothetical protein [Lentisphaeria bacterium]